MAALDRAEMAALDFAAPWKLLKALDPLPRAKSKREPSLCYIQKE
jgi:hypothetical protein